MWVILSGDGWPHVLVWYGLDWWWGRYRFVGYRGERLSVPYLFGKQDHIFSIIDQELEYAYGMMNKRKNIVLDFIDSSGLLSNS